MQGRVSREGGKASEDTRVTHEVQTAESSRIPSKKTARYGGRLRTVD